MVSHHKFGTGCKTCTLLWFLTVVEMFLMFCMFNIQEHMLYNCVVY